MRDKAISPGEQSPTIAFVFSGATNLRMGLPIGLNGVLFGTLVAFPLLLAVLSAEVLLNSGEIAESTRRIVVDAGGLRADVDPFLDLLARALSQLPWQVVPSPVELQILVPLEPLVADFAYEPVRRQKGLRRQRYHLRIWIWHSREISLFLGGGFGRGCLRLVSGG